MSLKNLSPLVESVLTLDGQLAEIARIGAKVDSLNFNSDADCEHAERLLARFAECSEGLSAQVGHLSDMLNEARLRAEETAKAIAIRAEELQSRKSEQQKKIESFQALGVKVRELTTILGEVHYEGEEPTEEERVRMTERLVDVERRLQPLIDEARALKDEANSAKVRSVEQGADALAQSLAALGRKLQSQVVTAQKTV